MKTSQQEQKDKDKKLEEFKNRFYSPAELYSQPKQNKP